ncbi:MAG: hypothetical protein ACI9IP_003122 [Arcticibacterium sp.]|jgi:hypothetical protein
MKRSLGHIAFKEDTEALAKFAKALGIQPVFPF